MMKLTPDDHLQMLQLQHLYGHVVDAFLWDRLHEVFAPDGVFDPGVGLPPMRGLKAILDTLIPIEEGPEGANLHSHVCTNSAIIGIGEDGVVKMLTKYIVGGDTEFLAFGEYEDDLVKTPDGWRISYRKKKRLTRHRIEYVPYPPA